MFLSYHLADVVLGKNKVKKLKELLPYHDFEEKIG